MRRVQHTERIGWHIINRGARRLQLFHEPSDFPQFLTFLKFSLGKSGAILWAYALMSNHYHLVLYATTEELRACMQRLNRLYSKYHNRKYSLTGHAFDGPYRAYPQDPSVLMRCIAYVLMNPVKAFLVDDPMDYAWTCYRQYAGLPGSPMPVDLKSLIEVAGPDPKTAWKFFHRAMEVEAKRPAKPYSDKLTATALQAQQFEWLLEVAQEREGQLGGEPPDLVAMCWARQQGIGIRSISLALGVPSGNVSNWIHRLHERAQSNPGLQAILSAP